MISPLDIAPQNHVITACPRRLKESKNFFLLFCLVRVLMEGEPSIAVVLLV